jgi:hypothetical protein
MIDTKLWKVFSEYIRLRDSDDNGNCRCFTCGLIRPWKQMDCGHGIGRQHWATRYNEKNNHAQCKKCNGFEGGKREVYKERVNKLYGPQTWDLLELTSRKPAKQMDAFTIRHLTIYYSLKVKEMKLLKPAI